jgi:hypothetical protein
MYTDDDGVFSPTSIIKTHAKIWVSDKWHWSVESELPRLGTYIFDNIGVHEPIKSLPAIS